MAYATVSDILARVDARILGDLVNDDNVRQTPIQLQTNANLAAALTDAASRITSNLLWANRYTVAQIEALGTSDLALVVHINCLLALANLNLRRGFSPDKNNPGYEEAIKLLESLRMGELLLNVPADVESQQPTASYPSATTYSRVNLLRDTLTPGLFSPRPQQFSA